MSIHLILKLYYNDNMLLNQSPDKENRSPQRRKTYKTIQQSLESSPQQQKRLKAKVADYQFQIKRLQQDFAQFRLLTGLQNQKTIRRLRSQVDAQRLKNTQESKKWEIKFSERQQQWQTEREKYRIQILNYYKEQSSQAIQQIQVNHKKETDRLIEEKQQNDQKSKNQLLLLTQQYQVNIKKLTNQHKSFVQNLEQQFKLEKQLLQKKYQSLFAQKQKSKQNFEKIIEVNNATNTKTLEKYLHQIGKLEVQKSILRDTKQDLQIKTKVLTQKLIQKSKEAQQIKQNFKEQITKIQSSKAVLEQQIQIKVQKQKISVLKQQYSKMLKFQKKYQQLNQKKEVMEQSYRQLLRIVQNKFDVRDSKIEDLELIKQFKHQIYNQQRNSFLMTEQIRVLQLEKENNEKMYTKIFTNQLKSKKSMPHRPDKDTSLWLQSNTHDLRTLLKINKK